MGKKYSVNENFFKQWTPTMAYVLGYIYADGSLEDASYIRGKYIRVSSSEENNVLKIKRWLSSKHKISKIILKNKKNVHYLLRIGSHKLYNSLTKLGLFPNKSLTIKFPQKVPDKYLSHFIRGYFDGDGCVRIWMSDGKTQKFILRKLSVVFTCGSKKFLIDLSKMIKKHCDTNQLNVYNGNRSFMLSYSTSDSVKIFKFLYSNTLKKDKILLKRKFDIFKKYFKLRPQRVDKKVHSILQYIS